MLNKLRNSALVEGTVIFLGTQAVLQGAITMVMAWDFVQTLSMWSLW